MKKDSANLKLTCEPLKVASELIALVDLANSLFFKVDLYLFSALFFFN
tara:strand:+ start:829 stop:972 length:144 start_codon:yes stop_codon:yes gene_type:complete